MRIDRLIVMNFNGFSQRRFDFHPQFNLLVGDNATGKASVLDALSIALSSWFLGIKGYERARGIDPDEVRVVAIPLGDRVTFEKQFPTRIEAHGIVMESQLH